MNLWLNKYWYSKAYSKALAELDDKRSWTSQFEANERNARNIHPTNDVRVLMFVVRKEMKDQQNGWHWQVFDVRPKKAKAKWISAFAYMVFSFQIADKEFSQ